MNESIGRILKAMLGCMLATVLLGQMNHCDLPNLRSNDVMIEARLKSLEQRVRELEERPAPGKSLDTM